MPFGQLGRGKPFGNLTETLKPTFRYLKRRERLTTIIALRCQNGIILSADSQETSEGVLATKGSVSKILPVSLGEKDDPYCLLGCSGVSSYIDLFRDYVGKAIFNPDSRSYFDSLDTAVRSYTRYVTTRKREIGLDLSPDDSPSAIFAGYEPRDQKIHMYILNPPHPPDPLTHQHSAAIGSGGLYAYHLFSIAELLMSKMNLHWYELSTNLVAQFSQLLMGRVMSYDNYSGMGTNTFVINTSGYAGLSNEQIFPSQGKEEKYRLTILLRTFLSEVPREKLRLIDKTYNLSKVIGDFLSEREPDSSP